MRTIGLAAVLAGALALTACGDREGSVGEFSNDFLGNEIMVEALHDPEIPNVVCHMTYFDRSALDRLRQGNWFENPSNSAVSCQRIGPISLAGLDTDRSGEEIFSQRQSLFFQERGDPADCGLGEPVDRLCLALPRDRGGFREDRHLDGGVDAG